MHCCLMLIACTTSLWRLSKYLSGIKVKLDHDIHEYETAGGVRRSDRKCLLFKFRENVNTRGADVLQDESALFCGYPIVNQNRMVLQRVS
jgi:hypothetical protein